MTPRGKRWLAVALILLAATAILIVSGPSRHLVVYCAHDSVYSESVLRSFEAETGIPVAIRFDSEATKSLGLQELLLRERDHPRCDVFWNNELLGTVSLAEQGLLEPYMGSGYQRIPAGFKDYQGYWTGFAARFRVYIVNTEAMVPTETAIAEALSGDLSRVAIAKPIYGTTLTHYSVLWHRLGEQQLKAWHDRWRRQKVRQVAGNATVKNLVASGVCDLGLTDTDDCFLALDDGKPVAMVPVRLAGGKTIAIPNTVSIIRGVRYRQQARRLVDYLLSAENELALAASPSRQVPLGPVDESALPEQVREIRPWLAQAVPLAELGPARLACLRWLQQEGIDAAGSG
jgi:iron(III) transport system substrate-binding protein